MSRCRAVCLLLAATAAAAQSPRYTDVAPRSAFAYITRNGFDGSRKYFPQPLAGGVAVLDFDRDGWMDLFFTNGATLPGGTRPDPSYYNALLRNRRDGTFEDVSAKAGITGAKLGFTLGAAAGDFDNDGYADLFVAAAGDNVLYRNNGDGTFRDVSARAGLTKPKDTLSVQGAWVDVDNDGRLDLVLSNYTLWTPATDRRCVREDGVDFYCHPKTYPAVPHRLYRNLGEGRFADVTDAAGLGRARGKGMGISVADVNRDGWMDLFIANDTEPNFLFLNQKDGTFREQGLLLGVAYDENAATVSAMGADVRDYDNDGWPDVFYNDLMNQVWGLFRNLAGKQFRYVSPSSRITSLSAPYSGWSCGFVDFDNDGWKDLYSANGDVDNLRPNAEQHDTLFRNADGRTFADVSATLGADFLRRGYQRGAAFADLNNDGAMDIVVTSLGKRPRILLHSGKGAGHWLLVQLEGRAIGASLQVTTPSGRVLHNHASPSVGFLSSSDPRVHFGLGGESAVSLEIRWTSGRTEVRRDVPAGRLVTLHEPE